MVTLDTLNLKMRQLYASVGRLVVDPNSVEPTIISGPAGFAWLVNWAADEADLANVVTLTLANLGNLKDALIKYCAQNNIACDAEAVVNTNFDVAVLFDAWQLDKHAERDHKLRVRHFPRTPPIGIPQIPTVKRAMRMVAPAGGMVCMTMDPVTGRMVFGGDGSANVVIDGEVKDDQGQVLGEFVEMVERAVVVWDHAYRAAGVNLPAR